MDFRIIAYTPQGTFKSLWFEDQPDDEVEKWNDFFKQSESFNYLSFPTSKEKQIYLRPAIADQSVFEIEVRSDE